MYLPKGFYYAAIPSGIKEDKLDLALIYSKVSSACAATFTKNLVKAAPVLIDMEKMKYPPYWAKAILVNSGNANACTGDKGIKDALICIKEVKDKGYIPEDEILVASTGVIGERLPVKKITNSINKLIDNLSDSEDALKDVANAILTTDTKSKIVNKQIRLNDTLVNIVGICKGAGMIGPDMSSVDNINGPAHATMLCFLMTDLLIDPILWQEILNEAVDKSFNKILVDGDTSTNDTVIALANGLCGNKILTKSSKQYLRLKDTINEILYRLSEMIVEDGEGATKSVKIVVQGTKTKKDALTIAKTIASSPLVKTAIYGEDPNWGRIIAAAGRSGIYFDPEKIDLYIEDTKILENGLPLGEKAEKEAAKKMKAQKFSITLDISQGEEREEVLTCDFSIDYIKINADYRT